MIKTNKMEKALAIIMGISMMINIATGNNVFSCISLYLVYLSYCVYGKNNYSAIIIYCTSIITRVAYISQSVGFENALNSVSIEAVMVVAYLLVCEIRKKVVNTNHKKINIIRLMVVATSVVSVVLIICNDSKQLYINNMNITLIMVLQLVVTITILLNMIFNTMDTIFWYIAYIVMFGIASVIQYCVNGNTMLLIETTVRLLLFTMIAMYLIQCYKEQAINNKIKTVL